MLPVSTPRLFGVTELGAALGWDRRKVGVYLLRGRLPQPAVRLACGPIWTGEQVDELLRQRGGVDADNKGAEAPPGHPAPAEHPPDPAAGLRPGRVFFHRQWTWADGRPRQCVWRPWPAETCAFVCCPPKRSGGGWTGRCGPGPTSAGGRTRARCRPTRPWPGATDGERAAGHGEHAGGPGGHRQRPGLIHESRRPAPPCRRR